MNVEVSQTQRPFAYADPRSLSRAWFDALYARSPRAPVAAKPAPAGYACAAAPAAPAAGHAATLDHSTASSAAREVRPQPHQSRCGSAVVERDRRPLPAVPARVRTLPPPAHRDPAPRLDVSGRTADGCALRLLLDGDAGRVRAVAICRSADRERVADALSQARIALAARGIAAALHLLESRQG